MPHRLNQQLTPPHVLISALTLPDTVLLVQGEKDALRLGVSENNFSINYSILNRSQQTYTYYYTLKGYDDHRVKADARTVANYTKIPGGDYMFRVKAVTGKPKPAKPDWGFMLIRSFIRSVGFRCWW